MDLPKCRSCGERHRLLDCPLMATPARKPRVGGSKPITEVSVGRAARDVAPYPLKPAATGRSVPKGQPVTRADRQTGVASSPRGTKRKPGRPLAKDKAKTFEATKPWLVEGMSRATWFRRQSEKAK